MHQRRKWSWFVGSTVFSAKKESLNWTSQPANPKFVTKGEDDSLKWKFNLTAAEQTKSQTFYLIQWKKFNQTSSDYDQIASIIYVRFFGAPTYAEPRAPHIMIDRKYQATLLINNVQTEDERTYKIEYSLQFDGTLLADHEVNVTVLDDASNETFLNEEVAGVLGLQEPFEKVQGHVETFQSMPLQIEIESVDGRLSKKVGVKTCPQKVTGSYRAVNWNKHQDKWPHLTQCSFPKPEDDGLVDLLIGIDNAELHYSHFDLRGKLGGPIARLGPLGWSCIGAPDESETARTRSHVIRSLFTSEPIWSERKESCCNFDMSLKRFWEIEKSGTDRDDRLVFTEEERLALSEVKDSLKYKNGRYRVVVPWKENKPDLPDTKPMALSRLRST
ncbi:hypothetical protein AWC38_SpisGene19740 [Stylophora pistillata]|uniref:Uncharacterized protein n=1 Tax=Stylophora pistillata TaxID=50429 RepID=A0A2B4REF3_STYPI|nr:hypothetical protein AWC38_SpisGene19740 [Stylophora pistillata]